MSYIEQKEQEFDLRSLPEAGGADDINQLYPGLRHNVPASLVRASLAQRAYAACRPSWQDWSEAIIGNSIGLNHTLDGKPIVQVTDGLKAKHAGWEKSIVKSMKQVGANL